MRYPDEEKIRIIEEVLDGGYGCAQRICEKYGISRGTLANWNKKFGNGLTKKRNSVIRKLQTEEKRQVYFNSDTEEILSRLEDQIVGRISRLLTGPLADNIAARILERLKNA